MRAFVTAIRDVRARQQVKPSRKIVLHVPAAAAVKAMLDDHEVAALLRTYANLERIDFGPAPAGAAVFQYERDELAISSLRDEEIVAELSAILRGHGTVTGNLTGIHVTSAQGDKLGTPEASARADASVRVAERARLEKIVLDAQKAVATLEGRLNNPGYADRAPPKMVEETKQQLAKKREELAAAEERVRANERSSERG